MRATCLILLSACEASPGVVCPVSVQEGLEKLERTEQGSVRMARGLEPQGDVVGDGLIWQIEG